MSHTIQETSCTNEKSERAPSNTRSMPACNERMSHQRAELSPLFSVCRASVVFTAVLTSARTRLTRPGLVQRLTSLLHQEVDKRQRRQGISPPPPEKPVEEEPQEQRQRHVGTGHAACGIGFERSAFNLFGDAQLALPQEGHDEGSSDGKADAPPAHDMRNEIAPCSG